jgi:hypothetical protein
MKAFTLAFMLAACDLPMSVQPSGPCAREWQPWITVASPEVANGRAVANVGPYDPQDITGVCVYSPPDGGQRYQVTGCWLWDGYVCR